MMPRAAQTIDSEAKMREESGEKDDDEETHRQTLADLNNNDSKTASVEIPKSNCSRIVNSSQNSIVFKDEDDESSPLRVIIGGKIKKFKKDSRVWLHKSSSKAAARRSEKQESKMNITEDNIGDSCSNLEYTNKEKASETIEVCYGDLRGSLAKDAVKKSDSTISIMGDSDADLSYSEEEFDQSQCQEVACKPSLPFYQSNNDSGVLTESEPMEVDDSPAETETNTNSASNLQDCNCQGESLKADGRTDTIQINPCPKCKNISQSCFLDASNKPTTQELSRRLAPAITFEEESFKESLIDYAVNHFGRQHPETRRLFSGKVQKKKKQKRKKRPNARKNTKDVPPWMRSCGCPYAKYKQKQSQVKTREECLLDFNSYLVSITRSCNGQNASINQSPCTGTSETASPRQVPSLLIMAAGALQKTNKKTDSEKTDEEDNMTTELETHNLQETVKKRILQKSDELSSDKER